MRRALIIAPLVLALGSCTPIGIKAPTGASQLPAAAASNKLPVMSPFPTVTPRPSPPLPNGIVTLSNDPAVSYRINASHTGGQAANLVTRRLAKRWSRDLAGPVSYPLAVGGKVFVTIGNAGTYGSTLVALEESTGKIAWGPIDLGGTSGFSGAAYDQGRLFVVNSDGLLRSFDATTGAPGWSARADGQYSFGSPPTAFRGTVYLVGAGSGATLYAFDETSGALKWTGSVNGTDSSPAVTVTGVYTTLPCAMVDDFAPSTGQRLWHHQTGCSGGGGATAVVYQGKVYARDWISGNVTLDASTGNTVGTFSGTTNPAFAANLGFFLVGSTLRAVDLSSGTIGWSFAGDGALGSAPVVAGDTVFTASSTGMVYAVNGSTGALVAAVDTHTAIDGTDEQNAVQRTSLAVGDGLLLVPAGKTLFAY